MAKNWAIAIGINIYSNLRDLNYAQRDAEAMRHWFENEGKFDRVFLFTADSPPIPAKSPISTQPTYGHLRRFLRAQFEQPLLAAGDNLWFFFAGHGRREADRDYLMLTDSDPGDVEHTAISVDYVIQRLRRSGADNVVLLLDACRDESSRGGLGIGQEHQGVITFYSCAAKQKSWEIEALQHGAFTSAVLEGLRIRGEGNCATVERLDRYLRDRVPQINRQYGKEPQYPYATADPGTKLHLILLPWEATRQDIATLREDALEAEVKGDLELAKQLWIRVLAISPADHLRALEAMERIWEASRGMKSSPISSSSRDNEGTRGDTAKADSATEERSIPPFSSKLQLILASTSPLGKGGLRGDRNPAPPDITLQQFGFDVVTVNARGKETHRRRGEARYFPENLGPGVSLEMVAIPGGQFRMGTEAEEIERLRKKYNADYFRRERPQHDVTVQPFFMGQTPITQAQWRVIASRTDLKVKRDLNPDPSQFKGEKRPVERVSWFDAMEFCARLSQLTRRTYRLPSEAEWEYACRAGTTTPFHFGATLTDQLANYRASEIYASEPKGKYRAETTPVASFPPNAFGLYDLHGNVWEWCWDDWHDNYENAPTDGRAWLNNKNSQQASSKVTANEKSRVSDDLTLDHVDDNNSQLIRVLRGGSWILDPLNCRSASRLVNHFYPFNFVGFRVVCGSGRTL